MYTTNYNINETLLIDNNRSPNDVLFVRSVITDDDPFGCARTIRICNNCSQILIEYTGSGSNIDDYRILEQRQMTKEEIEKAIEDYKDITIPERVEAKRKKLQEMLNSWGKYNHFNK